VQNYLIKPFNDQLIYTEIAKAMRNPWRNLHFEEMKSFCALMGHTPESLLQMRRQVMLAFDQAAKTYPEWAVERKNEEVFSQISALVNDAESAGVWAGVDFLRDLQEQATIGHWVAFKACAEYLDFASRLIFCQLNPSYVPDTLRSPAELAEAREKAERDRWLRADVDRNGPLLDQATLCQQIDGLPGCPVIDSVAASFQMVADGRVASMSQVMDLASSDPGLCAQVLVAANRVGHDEMNVIEDVRSGATLLGELKLHALAKALPIAGERYMNVPPLTWPNYWMFQVTVGRVAQFICSYLELGYLSGNAYTAGLLHDLGKLLLVKLHPHALEAIVRYAHEKKVPIPMAERRYLGCTTRDLALHFAQASELPPVYTDVIRWVETPEHATEHADLVAMVALARHVCQHAHVGCSGDNGVHGHATIAATTAWSVLQSRLFPSFDLKKFEVQAHAFCLTTRQELMGQRLDRRPTHAQRAAELV
jgi:HD-like signal output (HDOD) protein